MGRVGVLLLNLGGPEQLEDVRPFLFNLFADPEIIRLPVPWLQKPLAWLISNSRAKQSQQNYSQIGGALLSVALPSSKPQPYNRV